MIYIIISIIAILLGVSIGVYLFQEKLIFQTEKLSAKYKFSFKNSFEEITYKTEDGHSLNALLFKVKDSKGIIYYHHGNAGTLETWGQKASDFLEKGYDFLVYDYRGYGKSTGKIKSEKMLYADATLIYKELLYDYKERDIIVYGTSLGTGIASFVAQENHPSKLILETPYFNFYKVAKFHYPYLPNTILLNYQFKTNKYLPKVKGDVHLVHGTEDETVPYRSSLLLEELSDNITLLTIKEGSHNNLNTFKEYHVWLEGILK